MTLPTTTHLAATDADDSDIFGPSRTTLPYHHHYRHTRPKVSMISGKMRFCEERKQILQLCATKLESIKDTETCLRRSVCINNTYSRLTEEVRREKQRRYSLHTHNCDLDDINNNNSINNDKNNESDSENEEKAIKLQEFQEKLKQQDRLQNGISSSSSSITSATLTSSCNSITSSLSSSSMSSISSSSSLSSSALSSLNLDSDLEKLNSEISELDAALPLVDHELSQGAELLETISRKRLFSSHDNNHFSNNNSDNRNNINNIHNNSNTNNNRIYDESNRYDMHEPLSLYYLNNDLLPEKRLKTEIDFVDLHALDQNQNQFEYIMDVLKLTSNNNNNNNHHHNLNHINNNNICSNLNDTSDQLMKVQVNVNDYDEDEDMDIRINNNDDDVDDDDNDNDDDDDDDDDDVDDDDDDDEDDEDNINVDLIIGTGTTRNLIDNITNGNSIVVNNVLNCNNELIGNAAATLLNATTNGAINNTDCHSTCTLSDLGLLTAHCGGGGSLELNLTNTACNLLGNTGLSTSTVSNCINNNNNSSSSSSNNCNNIITNGGSCISGGGGGNSVVSAGCNGTDSCGQAAMLSENSFHNFVVASLET